jgi:hypothetical protein
LIVSDESRFVGLAIVRPCVHSEAGFSRTAADVSRHIIQVMPENTEFFGRCRTIADDYKRPPSPPPRNPQGEGWRPKLRQERRGTAADCGTFIFLNSATATFTSVRRMIFAAGSLLISKVTLPPSAAPPLLSIGASPALYICGDTSRARAPARSSSGLALRGPPILNPFLPVGTLSERDGARSDRTRPLPICARRVPSTAIFAVWSCRRVYLSPRKTAAAVACG